MSRITVTFDDPGRHLEATPVPVRVLDEHLNEIAEKVCHLSRSTSVEVKQPGLYLVSAELPSGEHVSATVRVGTDSPEAKAVLRSRDASPRESLAWAYARQGVRPAAGPPRRHAKVSFGLLPDSLTEVGRAEDRLVQLDGAYGIDLHGDSWRLDPIEVAIREDTSVEGLDARVLKRVFLSRDAGTMADFRPVYLRIRDRRGHTGAEKVSFLGVPMGPSAELLLLKPGDRDRHADPVRALVNSAGPAAGALLGYLQRGAYDSARSISGDLVENAEYMLWAKMNDPLAAAIAGYFLLRASDDKRRSWMKNLADWCPRLPDGAVIYATSLLRDAGSDGQAQAREYLLEAAGRGIPGYTVGLRLLFDALRGLAERGEKGDAEVSRALRLTRAVAAYTDWESQTTSFALPSGSAKPPITVGT